MIELNRFFRFIEPVCPGTPEPLMAQAIRGACIEFCEETDVIQVIDSQDLLAGVAEYSMPSATQQLPARVLTVFADTQQLNPTGVDDVRQGGAARAGADTAVETPRGTPQLYYVSLPSDSSIYLYPVPDVSQAAGLAIRASMRPTEDATSVADPLYTSYRAAVVAGTLATLFAMPTLGCYSMKAASMQDAAFRSEISGARGDARRGSVRSGVRAQPRMFY